jgi:hypothetical protein
VVPGTAGPSKEELDRMGESMATAWYDSMRAETEAHEESEALPGARRGRARHPLFLGTDRVPQGFPTGDLRSALTDPPLYSVRPSQQRRWPSPRPRASGSGRPPVAKVTKEGNAETLVVLHHGAKGDAVSGCCITGCAQPRLGSDGQLTNLGPARLRFCGSRSNRFRS